MENYLVEGGRVIICPYWYENEDAWGKQIIDDVGRPPTGYIIKTHYSKPNLIRKVMWFDKK